ncbi:MAG TPA: serine/threonine-protein kinase [Ktedonosporobacter sp.]|jgi:serine/threonine protein kinase/WD40 repeat protein|nr:serine/threonine-protein kinase [Ktedonosporobacter sp.]
MLMNQSKDWQGQMLGRYQMMRLLGRGGMGEVWLAEDTQLRRQVAVKLLPLVLAGDKDYLQAFEAEARTAASLDHPHILPVHDFGDVPLANGEIVTYLIIPYITGGTLRDLLRTTRILPVEKTISFLRQAAQAIDYAHSQRVLHRDIKPANMLLQQDWLFLTDFGIAKLLTTATNRSRTHSGAGTPEYMAPEQIQGKAEAASDLYSLAMTAYQLFTGTVPFKGETPYEVLIKHMQDVPTSPRQLNPTIPLAVETVLMQGLAKRPEERPTSCTAFVNALEMAWQGGISPSTDPDATILAPWSKRLRDSGNFPPMSSVPTQQGNGVAADPNRFPPGATPYNTPPPMNYAGNMATTVNNSMGSGAPVPVTPTQQRAISRRQMLIGGTAAAMVAVAGSVTAYTLLRAKPPGTGPLGAKPLPGPHKLIAGIPLLHLTGHVRAVWTAVWDPSGRYLATGGEDNTVMLWDVGTPLQKSKGQAQTLAKPLKSWRVDDVIFNGRLCWSSDGRSLVLTLIADANNVHVIDVFSNDNLITDYHSTVQINTILPPSYGAVAWSPIGNTFATGISETQQVALWQYKQVDKPTKILKNDKAPQTVSLLNDLRLLAWSSDGKQLTGITGDSTIVIWDAATGTIKKTFTLPDRPNLKNLKVVNILRNALQGSPTDPNMLAATNVDVVSVWDIQHQVERFQLGTDDPGPYTPPKDTGGISWNPNMTGMTWSPNGRYIAGGYGRSARLYVWDLQAPSPGTSKYGGRIQNLIFGDKGGHALATIDVAWSPNGRYLASTSFDNSVIVWQVDGA